jgi:hypothetical protein
MSKEDDQEDQWVVGWKKKGNSELDDGETMSSE